MSGIELMADGEDLKTLVVNEVAANFPGVEAGLKEEDELIARFNLNAIKLNNAESIRGMRDGFGFGGARKLLQSPSRDEATAR